MNWNISAWAIRNPVFSVLMFVVFMALGYVSFMGLPITRFPNIDVPVVAVTVTDNGSAPAELETQITKKIEDTVAGVTGVKHVTSTITDGQSTTAVEFRLEIDTDRAVNDVKDAIAKIRGDLPRTIDEPIIQRIDVENQAIVTYGVASPGKTLEELSWYVDDTVVRAIQGLKGVGRVERIGGVEREIHVSLDPDRLLSLGISAAAVNEQLRATNVDLSGGRGEVGGQEQAIRTLAGARTVDDLANTRIILPGGREVRLSDLGTVSDSWEEPRSFARLDGEPVVSFSVYRAKGASDATVADLVAAKVQELEAANPTVGFSLIDDSVRYTYGNYESAMHTLIEGALLAVLVVFIFLRDFRATIIAAVAMPLAAIPTFWAMDMMGFSLNLVSLLAITLVTGILVDDAIVEIENIVRHIRMGKKPYKAAIEAADEIGLAVIAITMTIIAVFAPVSFMGGVAGQYFKQFGLTVAVAVFFSLLVARLITPIMAAYFLRDHGHREERDGLVMRGYTAFLRGTLRFRWLTLVVGLGLFGTSIWSMQFLPTGFIPAEDASRIVASVELPPGSSLDDTRATTDDIKASIADLPEVDSVFVMGGTSPTGTLEVRRAAVIINLVRKGERERSQQVMEDVIAERFAAIPDIRWSWVNERGERELAIGIMSRDGEALSEVSAALEADMRRDPMFSNPSASAALDRPEIRIVPDLDKAADLGVSPEAISQTVSVATVGAQGSNLAKFTVGDRQIPIRVELVRDSRADLAVIESLRVPTDRGTTVPLSAVADVTFGQGPSSINRYDRERRVVLGADMAPGYQLGQGLERVKELPTAVNMPAGVRIQETGDAEIMGEVFSGFAAAMGAGIMMVLVVLILLFASVFQPLTILASLPLSVGGVVAALLVTQNAVSMPVVIGILMLMGIVTKNAIMLVDFAVEQEKHGVPQFDAIVDAGRKRARPIIMTTLAMTAGMVPAAMATGEGGEFRAPMAIAVIGGLIVSTVLSLIFIPTVYTMMDDLGRLVGRIFAWILRPNAADEDEPVVVAPHGPAVAAFDARVTPLPVRPLPHPEAATPMEMRQAAE
ncbi:efflux RND transporter permease subunit [Chthonobacter rhizosphaerae]|uniref:efflux RND transporter permease subunit n=1 Tax=Chthonobacter rhizosphaerae TaxID=2735553 RepID=UPI0015EF5B85|nr:efflux RND transporter permease subunit [Chthonobacter rhizosphaerae]